jgi:DNA polymerase I
MAIYNLLEFRAIETLLQTFIIPLQELSDETGRIHCSLNINTETGRLSARKPNLQNQPALEKVNIVLGWLQIFLFIYSFFISTEIKIIITSLYLLKDKYKIRLAFRADDNKKFIVADYGQLELRILAHMTDCKNMLEAFKSGGDFHSRTAIVI